MKSKLALALSVVAMTAITVPTMVEAANYSSICKSTKLKASERKECRARMKEADSKAEQAKIWKEYDLRMAGYAPDGSRLKDS
jgi:hypothetical protein